MADVLLKYVGKKPFAIDSIGGTGVVWNGNGDIQPVPEPVADKLLKHPDQWVLAPKTAAEQSKKEAAAAKKAAAEKEAAEKAAAEKEAAEKAAAEKEAAEKAAAPGNEDNFAA